MRKNSTHFNGREFLLLLFVLLREMRAKEERDFGCNGKDNNDILAL